MAFTSIIMYYQIRCRTNYVKDIIAHYLPDIGANHTILWVIVRWECYERWKQMISSSTNFWMTRNFYVTNTQTISFTKSSSYLIDRCQVVEWQIQPRKVRWINKKCFKCFLEVIIIWQSVVIQTYCICFIFLVTIFSLKGKELLHLLILLIFTTFS